jgi:predicted metal-binding protein
MGHPPRLRAKVYASSRVMQPIRLVPEHHLFVCANRREAGSPLGPGCSDAGDALYDRLKEEVPRRGLVRSLWITKTHCLGICPKDGATVALDPPKRMWAGAKADDAGTLIELAMGAPG